MVNFMAISINCRKERIEFPFPRSLQPSKIDLFWQFTARNSFKGCQLIGKATEQCGFLSGAVFSIQTSSTEKPLLQLKSKLRDFMMD